MSQPSHNNLCRRVSWKIFYWQVGGQHLNDCSRMILLEFVQLFTNFFHSAKNLKLFDSHYQSLCSSQWLNCILCSHLLWSRWIVLVIAWLCSARFAFEEYKSQFRAGVNIFLLREAQCETTMKVFWILILVCCKFKLGKRDLNQ